MYVRVCLLLKNISGIHWWQGILATIKGGKFGLSELWNHTQTIMYFTLGQQRNTMHRSEACGTVTKRGRAQNSWQNPLQQASLSDSPTLRSGFLSISIWCRRSFSLLISLSFFFSSCLNWRSLWCITDWRHFTWNKAKTQLPVSQISC